MKWKMKNYILFTLLLIIVSCKPDKPDNKLMGNWYGFDTDSAYYELYIKDTLIILNHENLGLAEYVYELDDNKLITTTPLFFERVWNVDSLTDSTFVISDTLGVHHFQKMHVDVDYFQSMSDSLQYYRFREDFVARNPKLKID
ncbi:hypothetical protein CLW00_103304 [Mongoliibacter ruber]|uniref:Lipocalin-like protein n=2 Tax=Mongoliibacter ruber TaxID=1750599 RepID=A0A2T0WR53_9BACT|nr:hypothetical protein CLW00_103304 [Mongoliibacter ruber]